MYNTAKIRHLIATTKMKINILEFALFYSKFRRACRTFIFKMLFLFCFFSFNQEFNGNTDQFVVVSHLLKNPINATRYMRINPVAWHDGISLRADLYGCKSGTYIFSPGDFGLMFILSLYLL